MSVLDDLGVIRDQRTMVGVTTPVDAHQTVADVEAGWQAWADLNGLTVRARRGDPATDLRESRKIVVAYISGSKWIGDCPACNGGVACWIANPRGCCLDCGTIYRVQFPSRADAERAVALLAERALETDRSWFRHRGETLDQLAEENRLLAAADQLDPAAAGGAAVGAVVELAAIAEILGADAVVRLRDAGAV